jgi:hypothetical protein
MVVIMGMGMPSLMRMKMRGRFSAAAKELQTELNKTRLLAMKSGEAHVFHYQPGTGRYEILPKKEYDLLFLHVKPSERFAGDDLMDLSRSQEPPEMTGTGRTSLADVIERSTLEESVQRTTLSDRMPEGHAAFHSTLTSIAAQASADSGPILRKELPDDIFFAGNPPTAWSPPIYFFPNGRTSSAELGIIMTGQRVHMISVSLRGLTGTAKAGEIQLVPR